MALTHRERIIMICAVLAVTVLVGDRYILSPVLEKRAELRQEKALLQAEVEQSLAALDRRKMLQSRWARMQEAGLSDDIQKIEGLLFRCLEESSGRSRLVLTSIQPDRLSVQDRLGRIDFMVSGTGTLEAVTHFLWDIETAEIPIRIEALQLGANDETAGQMSLQIKLSSIYLIADTTGGEGTQS